LNTGTILAPERQPSIEEREAYSDLVIDPALVNEVGTSNSQAELLKRIRSELFRQRRMDNRIGLNSEELAHVLESSPDTAIDPVVQLSASRRDELLGRLENEKARLNLTGVPTADNIEDQSAPNNMTPSTEGFQIRGAAAKARDLLEKKLRSQALLRVKLAREKGRMEGEAVIAADASSSFTSTTEARDDCGVNGKLRELRAQEANLQQRIREKLLKERLLLARKKP